MNKRAQLTTLWLVLLIFTFGQSLAQSANSTRIQNILETAKSDLSAKQYNRALGNAANALRIAQRLESEQLIWESKNVIGEIYLTRRQYDEAIHLFLDLAIHAERIENFSISANGYLSLGNIYSAMGAFVFADENYQKAYDQFEQIDYELGLVEVALAQSYNFMRSGQLEQADVSLKNLLTLVRAEQITYFELLALEALLEVNQKLGLTQEGIKYAEEYLELVLNADDQRDAAVIYNHLAEFNWKDGNTEKAEALLKRAEEIGKTNAAYNNQLSKTYQIYSQLLVDTNPRRAEVYKNKYEQLARQIGPERKPVLPTLEEAEAQARDIESNAKELIAAVDNQAIFKKQEQLRLVEDREKQALLDLEHDILLGTREFSHSAIETEYIHQDLMVAQHEYESRERQSEIIRYKQQLAMKALETKNQENEIKLLEEEKKILEQESALKTQQYFIIWGVVVAILLVAGIIGYDYRRVRGLNKLLERQKQTINQRNKALTASVELEKSMRQELQVTHDELKSTQANLIQAEKMSALGMLTAGIAHEVNNPISFVANGIEVIEENVAEVFDTMNGNLQSPEVKELKEDIEATIKEAKFGTDRIKEIVDGLRIFSRKDEADYKKASITEVIDSALLILKSKYKHKVEIIKEFEPNIPQIDCFPGQLNQVLINLIGNATDAIEDKGKVAIKVGVLAGKYVRIIVQDNGSGMPEEVRKKIFDPMFTTKEAGKGTGLGLSITTDIIKKHYGKIDVRSKVGVGTAFIIVLPIKIDKVASDPLEV